MGSRSLLWVFLLVGIFLAPIPKMEAQNWKDVTYNTCGGDGAFITGQQLLAGINMPAGLRDGNITWSFPAALTAVPADNKALDPVISGFVHGSSYVVEVSSNSNSHNYRITINATEPIGPYELTSVNGTGDVLLDNSNSYPVPFSLSPTDGNNYQYYYTNGDAISGTSGPLTAPNPWSFNPANQTEVYSVYGVVSKTVGGMACKAKSNEIQIADEKVVLEVVGGGSICDGETTPLPLSVKPYVPTYTYTWYKDGNPVGTGDSYTIDRSGGSWQGDYWVEVTGATGIITSEAVVVGAYQLTAGLIANGLTAFCGDISAELTGSASSTEGNLDYRWENSGTAVPAGSGFITSGIPSLNETETFTSAGSYRFVVRESDNPLCYAQSPAVLVESTIEANKMTVTGSLAACEGGSISNITLLSSEAGVTYRLIYEDGIGPKVMVDEWDSDGTSHTFSSVSAVGSYFVEATGCNGDVQMNGGPFVISALPDDDLTVVLSGTGCAGPTHTITVDEAESDVEYQLYRDGVAASGWRLGSALPFPGTTQAGDYSVRARRNDCEVTLKKEVRIGLVPRQLDFSPAIACANIPFTFELFDSEAGVTYSLFDSSWDEVDSYYSIGGGDFSFTVDQPEDTYTIVAQNDDGCIREFTETLVLQAPPSTSYSLFTNNDPACAGTTAHILSLDGSQVDVDYYLMRGTSQVSSAEGTGAPISFPDGVTMAGTYRVEASNGGCRVTLPTSLELYPRPTSYDLEDVGSFCYGEMVTIRLAQSQSGAVYSLYRDGSPYGAEKSSVSGGSIEFVGQFPPGVYTVGASFIAGACDRMMGGQVVVNALPNPGINSGNFYCADAGTIQLIGVPADGESSSWSINGVTGSVPWFTHAPDNPLAQVVVEDLIDARVGAGTDRAVVTFNYHFTDDNGCAATASRAITFVDDQSDNIYARYSLVADAGPWSDFGGDLLTCQEVEEIYLGAFFINPYGAIGSGVFTTNAPIGSITNAGAGDEGAATFHPDVAGNGLWEVTYSYVDPASGCEASITYNIQVGTTLSLHGLNPVYCKADASFSFYGDPGPGLMQVFYEDETDPAPREQTGNGSGNPFTVNPADPAWLAGNYLVRYTHTVDGCENVIENTFSILEEVDASFTIEDGPQYCTTGTAAVELTPTQNGGTFSIDPGGTGVTPNGPQFFFYPDQLLPGEYEITYTIQTGNCSDSEFITVIVVEPDQVDISNLQATYCQGVEDFEIWANNLPAIPGAIYTFTATANAGGRVPIYLNDVGDLDTPKETNSTSLKFSPSYVGPGTYYITYSFDNTANAGCVSTITKEVRVLPVPGVDFGVHDPVTGTTHTTLEFCQNADPVYLKGDIFSHPSNPLLTGTGYFVGVGIDNEAGAYTADDGYALFDPSIVTAGDDHSITYRYTHHNGCVSERTREFDILPAPIRQRVTPVNPNDGIFCEGETGVTIGLLGTQVGVSYYLYKDGVIVAGQEITGSAPQNQARYFSEVSEEGLYTVRAVMSPMGAECRTQMDGEVIVRKQTVIGVLESKANETCAGSDDGSVTFSAYGGVAPYTYTLRQGGVDLTTSASGTFGGLAPGTYTVHIEDAVGCDWTSEEFVIEAGSDITVVSEDEIDVVCYGESNGAFAVVATGLPSGNYEFQLSGSSAWLSNGTGRYVFNNLPAGTYDVTVRDADNPGCQEVMAPSVEISQPTEAIYMDDDDITPIDCSLDPEGVISVMAAGGNEAGGFNYVLYREVSPGFWVNIAASPPSVPLGTPYSFPDLFAGNYRVVATDSEDCSVTEHYTVDGPASLPTITLSGDEIVHVSQPGLSDGSIQVAITGGVEPYSIVWSGLAPDGTTPIGGLTDDVYRQENLSAGTYSVTVTDDNTCSVTLSDLMVLDDAVSAFDLTYTTVNPGPCFGSTNGRINLRAFGGITPYLSLTLTNTSDVVQTPHSAGNSFANYENLPAGNYTATVVDSRGVPLSETIELTQPSAPVALSHAVSDANCFGGNGNLVFSATGGTPFAGTAPAPDYYNFSILPVSGIAITGTIEVGEIIDVHADLPATDQLPAGAYQLTVTDAVSCFAVYNFSITQPDALTIQVVDRQHNLCHGASDGSITVSVDGRPGGTAFDFEWERYDETIPDWVPYATGPSGSISNLAAGTYQVKATETAASSCESDFSGPITIGQPAAALDVSATPSDISTCNGDASGSVRLSVTGGTAPYTIAYGTQTISWNGLNDYVVTGLVVGTYDFTITDDNGCSIDVEDVPINEPALFEASVTGSGITCETAGSGWIELNVSGGVDDGGFAYHVRVTRRENNQVYYNQTDPDPAGGLIRIEDLATGTYEVLVRDANSDTPDDCAHSFEIELRNMVINANVVHPSCAGQDNGSIEAMVTGGSGNFTYAWTFNGTPLAETSAVLNNLEPGTYELTVTDLNNSNCTVVRSYDLAYSSVLAVDVDYSEKVSCHGGSDGWATALPSGGSSPYFYLWERQDGATWTALTNTETLSNRAPGTYRVRVTDSNNCQLYSTDVVIGEPADFSVASINYDPETVSCNGGADGSFEVVMAGGSGNFEYSIDAVNWQILPTFEGLAPGSYRISVRDMERPAPYCAKYEVATATILDAAPVVLSLVNQENVSCFEGDNGVLEIEAQGGTAVVDYNYQWYKVTPTGDIPQSGKTDAEAIGLTAGTYFVEVLDDHDCLAVSETFTLTQPADPIVIMESNVQHVSVPGGSNGSITIAISGGTPGYSIQWYALDDPGTLLGTGLSLSGLREGDYRVVVTDNAIGGPCSEERIIKITEPGTALGLTEVIEAAGPCHGASNGSIELTALGGAGGYTFTLLRQPATEVTENVEVSGNRALYTGLSAGLYTARVRDANGTLVELLDLEVGQPTPLEIFNFTFNHVSCFGANDGSLRFSIRGGTPDGSGNYAYVLVRGNGSKVNGSGHTAVEHNDLVPDDYVLTVYDATNVCFAEERFTITEPADIAIVENVVDATCKGDANGSIRIEVSGGASGAFSYEWQVEDATAPGTWLDIADSNTAWLQNRVAGNYRVEVTDLGSTCTVTSEAWTIGEPDELTIVATPVPVNTCKGDDSGRIEVWVEGGVGPYVVDYGTGTVSGAGPEFFIEDLVADTYTLVVRDRNGTGCQDVTTVEIEEPAAALAVSDAAVSISCVDDLESFSVEFEVSGGVAEDLGGVPVFSYHIEVINLLTSGRRTKDVLATADQPVTVNLDDLNLPAGEYRVIVSDLQAASSAACAAVETSFVYKHLNVQNFIGHESCPGAFDGSIDLSVSGGSGNYTYAWTKGGTAMTQTTQDLSGLEAGAYTVTITDIGEPAGRCTYSQTFTVNRAKELLVEGSVQDVSCFDGSNGAIRIHGVANATMPLTYFWNGSSVAGGAELSGLTDGDYSVEILDGDGCRVQEFFSIEQPDAPLDASLTSELDCTSDTRSITVAASDGTGPYTYQWMGPGAYTRVGDGATIAGITRGGTWQVEVTDARGCKVVETIVVYGKVRLSAELTHINCVGGNGGNIVLDVSGGSGSYSYSWTKDGAPYPVATKDLNNLVAGKYQVVVTDLSQSCSGGGAYTVDSEVFDIIEPDDFVVEGDVTHNECYGSAAGAINLHTVTGGTAPYRFEWTTGDGSGLNPAVRNQNGLTAGTYYVRVIDDRGCSSDQIDFKVEELPELFFDLEIADTNCEKKNSIRIFDESGGTGTYRFFWNGSGTEGGTELLKEDLPGGSYTITMVDMGTPARCEFSRTVELTEPLEVSYVVLPETCSGMANGAITLDVKGGKAPYTFVWEAATGIEVNDRNQAALPAGIYEVTVTDSRDPACDVTLEIEVPLLHNLELQAAIDDVECFGGNNGAIYLSVLNGSGTYSYQWTKGGFNATTKDLSMLEAGTYRVVVTDEVLGCTVSGVFYVLQPAAPITISVGEVTHNNCFGENNGAIPVTVSGGTVTETETYTFLWDGPGNLANPSLQNQTGLAGGDYYLTVTDAKGCTLENFGPITVDEPAAPVSITLVEVTPVTATGGGDGSITVQVSGGSDIGLYDIIWKNEDGVALTDFDGMTYASGLSGGTYTISVEDDNECDAKLDVFVFEPGQALALSIDKQASGPCYGAANGKLWVQVQGGLQPYASLTLSDGTGVLKDQEGVSTAVFDALAAGDYSVSVTDALGHTVTQDVEVHEVAAPLAVTATVTEQVDCRGGTTGKITATVTGGMPDASGQYHLILSGGPAGTSELIDIIADGTSGEFIHVFDNLPKGTYTVRVIDDSNVLRVKHSVDDLQAMFGNDKFEMGSDCSVAVTNLIVRQPEALVHLSVEPGSEEVCAGVAPRLVAATSGWDFADDSLKVILSNGDDFVVTAASQVLTLTTLPVNAFTTYTIVSVTSATVAGCEKGEGTGLATVIRHERPTASLSGTTSVCAGETAYLNLQLTGTAPWQVSYSDGTSTYWINDITSPTYQLEVSPAATTTYTVETVADANCTGSVSGEAIVTVPVASTVEFVGDASRDICAGESETLEVAFDPADNGPWQLTYSVQPLVGGLPSGAPLVRTVTVDAVMFNGAGNYEISVTPAQTVRYRLEGVVSGGCAGTVEGLPIDVLVGQLPGQPGAIAGPVEVCQGATATFSVPALPGVSHYVWTLPGGVEVESGRELTTTFAEDAVSGRLSVYAVNACGDGPLQYMDLVLNPLPDASDAEITGPEDICQGSKGVVFTIDAIPHAETYNWTLSVGTIVSGQGSAQISVDFADEVDHFNGVISVQAENDCGVAVDEVSKAFTVRPLPTPNAGVDQLALCGNEVTLDATPLTAAEVAAGAKGRWLSLPVEGSADPIIDVTNPTVTVTGLSRGDVSFRWVVTSPYGCESYDDVTVRNNQLLVSAWAESDAVCNGTAQLRGTNPDVGLSVSGQWTVVEPVLSVAVFDNAASPSAVVSDMPAGRNVFRWTLNQNGCESPADVVIMNNEPADAVILGPAIVSTCGDPVTLEAEAPGVDRGTGSWSVISGYAQILSPTSATTVVQSMNFGDTELQWTVTKGHCQTSARVIIRNNEVWVDAGPEQDLCSAQTLMDASEVPADANGSWHVISGAANFAEGSNPATAVSALGRGENVLEWRINKNGCISSDRVSIWNNSATAATVGSALTVCNELPTLSGNEPLLAEGETGYWSVVSGSGTFVDASQHDTQVGDLAFGENVFRWTINNNNKCTSSADLRVTNLKTFVDAGKDTVICDNPVILRANPVPAGMTGAWTIVPGQGGGTIVVDDPSRPHIVRVGLDQGPNTLEWTINNRGCYSTDRVVVVNSRPYPVDGGPAYRVIAGTEAFMEATLPGAGQTGTWLLMSGGADIDEPNNPTTLVRNLRRGENVFRWVVTNGYCSDFDEVVIVNGDVVDANAGRNQVICGNSTRLDANDPEGALGAWTRVKGTAVFANPYDPRTQVSNLAPGENILRWTISYGSSGSSTSSSDEVVIYNNQPATARTMDDVVLCDDNLIIRANVPGVVGSEPMGTPFWEVVSGAGDLLNPNGPETLVENLAKGVNVLVYSITKVHEESNTTCVSRDTLEVINGLPTIPVAGESLTICTNEYLLNPNIPEHGVGIWRSGSVGGATFDGNRVYNLAQGDNELIYEIATEWCSLEDRIVLTNNKPSDSYAGRGRDVCTDSYVMEARAPQYGIGTWEKISGGGVIAPEDLNDPMARVTGLTSGSNRFRWVVDNNGCTSVSEVEIRYNFIAADAGDDFEICEDFSFLNGSNPMLGTGTWGVKGGSGSAAFEDINDPLTRVSGLDRGPNVLTWTVSNVNCSDVAEVTIYNNKPTIPDAGDDQSGLCEPETILQGNTPAVGVGRWTVISGSATFHSESYAVAEEDPNARVTNLSFGPNTLRWTVSTEGQQVGYDGCSLYDEVVLTYNRVEAFAGNDRAACADEMVLSARNPSPGTGMWSVPGGQGAAVFEDPTSPNTRVHNLGRGQNTLRWTVWHNGCSTYDEVVVDNQLPSRPYAGNDIPLCKDNTIMDATAPEGGSAGRWRVVTGSAVFADETDPKTAVSGLSKGDNIFIWTTERIEGCILEDEVLIQNHEPSDPYAGADYEEVCANSFTLKATAPEYGSGIWSFEAGGGNLSDPNDPEAVITALNQGRNLLRWTVSQGHCSKWAEVEIINNTPTKSNAGPDIEDCKDTQTLDANVPVHFERTYWERISGYGELDDINDPKSVVRNLAFGANEFQWVIENGNCRSTDRVVIFNQIPDKAFAGSDQLDVCDTYTVLNANDPVTGVGKWSVLKGRGEFDDPQQYNTIVRNLGFGENIFLWEVTYGTCSTRDEMVVVSHKTEAYAGEDQVVYQPEVLLNANNAGELDAQWYVEGNSTAMLNDERFFNTSVSNLSAGINSFRWEINVNGCISSDRVSVDYRPVPDAGFIVDVEEGCYPLRVQFTNYSVGGSQYLWHFGDGSTSADRNPVHVYERPGTYSVQLVSPGPDGQDGLYERNIRVFDHPIADFAVNPTLVYIPGEKARFYDLSTDAVGWWWDFGDGVLSEERNPSHEYQEEGVYDVVLTVSNVQGCLDTLTVTEAITAEPQGIVVFPNAFRPRPGGASSTGVDPSAEYVVVFKPAYRDVDDFTLEIYNRWGQKIFETKDIESGWDGMFEGQMAPQAVYVYKATGTYINGRSFKKSGSVLLVR